MDKLSSINESNTVRATSAPASQENRPAAAEQAPAAPAAETTAPAADTATVSSDAQQGELKRRPVSEQAPPGFDQTKWNNPNHKTPKYEIGRAVDTVIDSIREIPDEAGRKKAAESFLKTQIPVIEKAGGKVLQVKNEKMLIDFNDGKGAHWIDTIQDIDGKAIPQWLVIDDKPQAEQPNVAQGANGGMFDLGSMFGMQGLFGMGQDVTQDPAVQQTIQKIQAAGGHVVYASRDVVLAEMNDGQGPRWVPVERQQQGLYNGFGQQQGMMGQNLFSFMG